MKLQILYDNHGQAGFKDGWGFSCYLPERKLLFDTGWDARRLLHNMKQMDVEPGDIEKIVVSHSHWDHVGGLPCLLEAGVEVVVPTSFSEHMKSEIREVARLTEVSEKRELLPGVHTSGELGGEVKEQALAVESEKGLLVLTGCAHPGVEKIFNAFRPTEKIRALVGGLHGFDKYQLLNGLDMVAPAHCTKNEEEIFNHFGTISRQVKVGREIVWE